MSPEGRKHGAPIMSTTGNSSESRSRKRRLDHDQDRAAPSLETNSTAAAAAVGRNRSPFPQFSVPEHSARRQALDATSDGVGSGDSTNDANGGDHDPYGVDDDDAFDAIDLPNDTMAAVLSLQKEFYGAIRSPPSGRRNSASSSEGEGSSARLGGGGGERTGIVLQHQM